MVVRTMFTCGSRLVIMRQAVSAQTKVGLGGEPQAFSMRAHNFRSARNLAMVKNSSWSAARRKKIKRRQIEIEAVGFERPQISERVGNDEGKLSQASEPPAACTGLPSATAKGPAKPSEISPAISPVTTGASSTHGMGNAPRTARAPSGSKQKRMFKADGLKPFARTCSAISFATCRGGWTEIQLRRDTGIEIDIVEDFADGFFGRRQLIAVVADSALEYEV